MTAKSKLVGAAIHAYLSSRPAKHAFFDLGRLLRGGRRRARLYYRADDPYSHLLAQVVPRLASEYALDIEIVPIARPGLGANPSPEMLLDHALRDAAILAERFQLSFPADAKPPPADRVRRAHAVLLEPRPADAQRALAVELGEAVWHDDGRALGAIVERHGGISGESVVPALEANYEALERAGHYQPGMLHYGGDWYWGVDRLAYLESRLRREGLEGSLGLEPGPAPSLASLIEEAMSGEPQIELFFSFRSPYSYLALPQLLALRERYGVEVKVRPVLPMVMRGLAVPREKRLYIVHDSKREADRLGIPFGRICDPLGKGIGYCMAVFFHCAEGTTRELEFLHSVAGGIWSEARDVSQVSELVDLAGRAGIDEAAVRTAVNDRSWKERAQANRDRLTKLGLWGVPSLKLGSYVTWGQDRIPLLEGEIARLCA